MNSKTLQLAIGLAAQAMEKRANPAIAALLAGGGGALMGMSAKKALLLAALGGAGGMLLPRSGETPEYVKPSGQQEATAAALAKREGEAARQAVAPEGDPGKINNPVFARGTDIPADWNEKNKAIGEARKILAEKGLLGKHPADMRGQLTDNQWSLLNKAEAAPMSDGPQVEDGGMTWRKADANHSRLSLGAVADIGKQIRDGVYYRNQAEYTDAAKREIAAQLGVDAAWRGGARILGGAAGAGLPHKNFVKTPGSSLNPLGPALDIGPMAHSLGSMRHEQIKQLQGLELARLANGDKTLGADEYYGLKVKPSALPVTRQGSSWSDPAVKIPPAPGGLWLDRVRYGDPRDPAR